MIELPIGNVFFSYIGIILLLAYFWELNSQILKKAGRLFLGVELPKMNWLG